MGVSVKAQLIKAFVHEIPVRATCTLKDGSQRHRVGMVISVDFHAGLIKFDDRTKGVRSQRLDGIQDITLIGAPQATLGWAEREALDLYLKALARAGEYFTQEELMHIEASA